MLPKYVKSAKRDRRTDADCRSSIRKRPERTLSMCAAGGQAVRVCWNRPSLRKVKPDLMAKPFCAYRLARCARPVATAPTRHTQKRPGLKFVGKPSPKRQTLRHHPEDGPPQPETARRCLNSQRVSAPLSKHSATAVDIRNQATAKPKPRTKLRINGEQSTR